jgi:hypothetical protein
VPDDSEGALAWSLLRWLPTSCLYNVVAYRLRNDTLDEWLGFEPNG